MFNVGKIDKKEALYWTLGIVFFILIAVYLFYSVAFLIKNAKNVFGDNLNNQEELVKFNLEKAKEIRK